MIVNARGEPMSTIAIGTRVKVRDRTHIEGEVVQIRGAGVNQDVLVRYTVQGGRRPFYEHWWPVTHVDLA